MVSLISPPPAVQGSSKAVPMARACPAPRGAQEGATPLPSTEIWGWGRRDLIEVHHSPAAPSPQHPQLGAALAEVSLARGCPNPPALQPSTKKQQAAQPQGQEHEPLGYSSHPTTRGAAPQTKGTASRQLPCWGAIAPQPQIAPPYPPARPPQSHSPCTDPDLLWDPPSCPSVTPCHQPARPASPHRNPALQPSWERGRCPGAGS